MFKKYIAKNIIISLDFDGVLAHGLKAKIKYAKKWFGVDLALHQTKKDGFEALMKHLGREYINYRTLMDPLNEKHIMEYEVPHNCIPTLKRLYEDGFRFVIITSRNDHDYPYAKKFVNHNFHGLIKYIHNTRNEPKDAFVKKIHPRIHLDDDLEKLVEINNNPIDLFYYRQPENAHFPLGTNRIKEVRSWEEFYVFSHKIKLLDEAVCWKYNIRNNYRSIYLIHQFIHKTSPANLKQLLQEFSSRKLA